MTKVYLIGAGPGNPGLITVKGLEILREADVVIYDYLVNKELLKEARAGAELICCDKLGKNRYSDGFLVHQARINALVVKKAAEGKRIVRLKNGDPSTFGRLSQELDNLVKNRIKFEIIPGVTAGSAASAMSGIPLTSRKFASSCVFVAGREDPAKKKSALDWGALGKSGTIVLYMAVETLGGIVKKLIEAGKDRRTPVAVVKDASLLTQKTLTGTLNDIVKKVRVERLKPPAIIIIGDVVKFEKKFDWLKKNRRILFTGLSEERFFLPAVYFHLPLINIEPMEDYKGFDGYLKKIKKFDWIVFSSRYGVEYFFKRLLAIGLDLRALKNERIAAIGNSTASRLRDFGIIADLIPKEESSRGLLREFAKVDIKGKEIFLPRSDISDKNLNNAFKRLGATVSAAYAYRNVMPAALPDLDLRSFHEVMFTSPSGVRNFVKRYGRLPKGVRAGCIGNVTLKEAKKWRLLN
jgi:uroporphyrinogen III methyltransferase / synthase